MKIHPQIQRLDAITGLSGWFGGPLVRIEGETIMGQAITFVNGSSFQVAHVAFEEVPGVMGFPCPPWLGVSYPRFWLAAIAYEADREWRVWNMVNKNKTRNVVARR